MGVDVDDPDAVPHREVLLVLPGHRGRPAFDGLRFRLVAFFTSCRARTRHALTYEGCRCRPLHKIKQDPTRVERACSGSLRKSGAGCAGVVAVSTTGARS